MFDMITREKRRLIGNVRKVAAEYAVIETIDDIVVETQNQQADYAIYDFDGKLIEETSNYRLLLQDAYKHIYSYDSEGKLLQRDEYDENEQLIGKTLFEQDDGNRIEKSYYFDEHQIPKLGGRAVYRESDDFDDSEDPFNENLIEKVSYDVNAQIIPSHTYKVDLTRKDRKEIVVNNDGYKVVEFRYNKHNEFSHRIETIYDSRGNIKEYSCFENDGTFYLKDEYTYEYDLAGNWIKQIQHHWVIGWGEFHLVPTFLTRRTIDYY